MCKAWKKLIYEGSRPVGPSGIVTSQLAITPTLAAWAILFDSTTGLISKAGSSVNNKPTLFLHKSFNTANYGIGVPNLFK